MRVVEVILYLVLRWIYKVYFTHFFYYRNQRLQEKRKFKETQGRHAHSISQFRESSEKWQALLFVHYTYKHRNEFPQPLCRYCSPRPHWNVSSLRFRQAEGACAWQWKAQRNLGIDHLSPRTTLTLLTFIVMT